MLEKKDLLKNTGFISAPPEPADFIAGTVSGIPYEMKNAAGDWVDDLPTDEVQSGGGGDAQNCVSQSADNVLETQLNRFLRLGQVPLGLADWLKANGYFDLNGKTNFSDRFTAKMANTGPNGTTLKIVCDSIRHNGLLPESDWTWDWTQPWNRNEYYKEIPQNLKDKALSFLKFFDISYEVVRSIDSNNAPINFVLEEIQLKHAPLQYASATCPPWGDGIIPACDAPAGHAYECYNIDDLKRWQNIFDTYFPFRKKLAPDYSVPYIQKIVLSVKTFELTTEQARFAYCVLPGVAVAFPGNRRFVSDVNPAYTIYDWCRRYGVYQYPEVFIDNRLDWSKVDSARQAEAEWLAPEIQTPKKKVWFVVAFQFLKDLIFKQINL